MQAKKDPYQEIRHLSCPKLIGKPLSKEQWAAQYMPFAALIGFEELIDDESSVLVDRIELSEFHQSEINAVLEKILASERKTCRVRMTCFKKDPKKRGGTYETIEGVVRMISLHDGVIHLTDGRKTALENLFEIRLIEDHGNPDNHLQGDF